MKQKKNATTLLKDYSKKIDKEIDELDHEEKKILREAKISLSDIINKNEQPQSFDELNFNSLSLFTKLINEFFIKSVPELKNMISHQPSGPNFAIGHLFGLEEKGIAADPLFAISKNNINFRKESMNKLKENKVTITTGAEIEEFAPHNRLHVDNLLFYKPTKKARGFADKTCAERKIVAYLLKMIEDKGLSDLEGCRLSMYTKLEPCIYCFNLLDSFRKQYGVEVYLIYNEMVRQMRDELSDNPKLKNKIDKLLDLYES